MTILLATELWLASGDSTLDDSINLIDAVGVAVDDGGLEIPEAEDPAVSRAGRARRRPQPEPASTRSISLKVTISGVDTDDVQGHIRVLERFFEQAQEAQGPHTQIEPVCLWLRFAQATQWVFADVLGGVYTPDWKDPRNAPNLEAGTITLECQPLFRGAPIVHQYGRAIGNLGTQFYANIPGDSAALVQLFVRDLSAGRDVASRLRVARKALVRQPPGAYTPVLSCVPAGAATALAEANSLSGSVARLPVTHGTDWQPGARVRVPATMPGLYDLRLRLRDGVIAPGAPTALAAAGATSGGSLGYGSYTAWVAGVTAGPVESAPAGPVTVTFVNPLAYTEDYEGASPSGMLVPGRGGTAAYSAVSPIAGAKSLHTTMDSAGAALYTEDFEAPLAPRWNAAHSAYGTIGISTSSPIVGSQSLHATLDTTAARTPTLDDFESGSFVAGGWATTVTAGTMAVSNVSPIAGTYSAKSTFPTGTSFGFAAVATSPVVSGDNATLSVRIRIDSLGGGAQPIVLSFGNRVGGIVSLGVLFIQRIGGQWYWKGAGVSQLLATQFVIGTTYTVTGTMVTTYGTGGGTVVSFAIDGNPEVTIPNTWRPDRLNMGVDYANSTGSNAAATVTYDDAGIIGWYGAQQYGYALDVPTQTSDQGTAAVRLRVNSRTVPSGTRILLAAIMRGGGSAYPVGGALFVGQLAAGVVCDGGTYKAVIIDPDGTRTYATLSTQPTTGTAYDLVLTYHCAAGVNATLSVTLAGSPVASVTGTSPVGPTFLQQVLGAVQDDAQSGALYAMDVSYDTASLALGSGPASAYWIGAGITINDPSTGRSPNSAAVQVEMRINSLADSGGTIELIKWRPYVSIGVAPTVAIRYLAGAYQLVVIGTDGVETDWILGTQSYSSATQVELRYDLRSNPPIVKVLVAGALDTQVSDIHTPNASLTFVDASLALGAVQIGTAGTVSADVTYDTVGMAGTRDTEAIVGSLASPANEVALTWTPGGGVIDHEVYIRYQAIVYKKATGSTGGSYTLTSFSGFAVVGAPPSAPDTSPSQIMADVRIAGSTVQGTPTEPVLPNQDLFGDFQLLYVGLVSVPPVATPRGQPVPESDIYFWIKPGAVNDLVADFAEAILIPSDEPQLEASAPALDLIAPAEWVLATAPDTRVTAYRRSGTAPFAAVGQLGTIGELTAGPGDNVFVLLAESLGGICNVTTTLQVQLRIVPRFRTLRGR